MASLQRIKNTCHVRFRFGGRALRCSLETTDQDEAEAARMQVELTLHRIKTGVLPPPTVEADVALYIISGGKVEKKAVLPLPSPSPESLRTLWDSVIPPLFSRIQGSTDTDGHRLRQEHVRKCVVAARPRKTPVLASRVLAEWIEAAMTFVELLPGK